MLTLLVVAFLAGLVAGISPCVLPVLPVVLAGWAPTGAEVEPTSSARRRRSIAIVAGLVLSFSLITALGSQILSALHLPDAVLHDLGIATLVLFGASLLIPQLEALLERPFARFARRGPAGSRSGFALGLGLGLVFVPCAGPVLATVAVLGARHKASVESVALSFAFGIGVAIPLLVIALAGDRIIERKKWLTNRGSKFRKIAGVALLLMAVAIATNLAAPLQRDLPGYTQSLQNAIEGNHQTTAALRTLQGASNTGNLANCEITAANGFAPDLSHCGMAPEFTGITGWRNTKGNTPLTLASLRGHVVLVDFWTYTCINCQRTIPHVEGWYQRYQKDGLVVIGVAAPEFAFEKVPSNIEAGANSLGITYPIAIDVNLATWSAYGNEYWPAEYLIDATGVIRHVDYGEGNYAAAEGFIRTLLHEAHPSVQLPPLTNLPDTTPTEALSPETYLGSARSAYLYNGTPVAGTTTYTMPSDVQSGFYGLGGTWTTSAEHISAGANAALNLNFQARDVYLVLSGNGSVTETLNGRLLGTLPVRGFPTLHTLAKASAVESGLLHVTFTPGVSAYAFTFG